MGIGRADAIRLLHDEWGVERLRAGEALGASTDELRAAGCTATEMLAAAPREELRRLDLRESTWTLAGPALLDAGFTKAEAVNELALHAPNSATFAAAVTALLPDPVDGFSLALPKATLPDLAALSERYGLSPVDTASVLSTACADVDTAVAVVTARCDGDVTSVAEICATVLAIGADDVNRVIDGHSAGVAPSSDVVDLAAYRDVDDLAIVDL